MESNNKQTKRCPYCGEEIMASAKKCRYCGEWLDKGTQPIEHQEKTNEKVGNDVNDDEPSMVPSLFIMGVAAFIAVFLIAFYRTSGLNLTGHQTAKVDNAVDTCVVDTTDYDGEDTYDTYNEESSENSSDDYSSESENVQSDDYCETGMRCKGKFINGGTPIELEFSIDEEGCINDGTVRARLTNQEFNDLTGRLSGKHLEMNFADGGSSISLDIVSGNKMTGTVEGDEVEFTFKAIHS